MRLDRIIKVFLLVSALASVAHADDLEDARRAYGAGEFGEASTLLRPLAREGNVEAQYLLGRLYEQGDGVAKDESEARRLYQLAAGRGHKLASERLAVVGKSQSADESVALGWYLPAAKQGDIEAQYNLGYMYETGWGVSINEKEAARWYQEAATGGHDQAQLRLGLMYMVGAGVAQSKPKGVEWLRKAAAGGSRVAERLVQELFDSADGASLDAVKVISGLRRIIDEGDKRALATLLSSLESARSRRDGDGNGNGRRANNANNNGGGNERAESAPVRATPQATQPPQTLQTLMPNDALMPVLSAESRQSNQSSSSTPGMEGLVDDSNSFRAAQVGASQGKPEAQFELAVAYIVGRGVRKDQQEALSWFKQAAAKGHDGAQTYMHLWDDQLEAAAAGGTASVGWLKEAARHWDLDAMFRLGYLFETGRGVTTSVVEAAKWYRLAGDQGHVEARRRLSGVERGGGAAAPSLTGEPGVAVDGLASAPSIGIDGRVAAGILAVLLAACVFYVRRKGIPRIPLGSGAAASVIPAGMAKNAGPASEDLAFLKDLWADGAAAHAKATPAAAKPNPAADAAKRAPEGERVVREARPEKQEQPAKVVAAPVPEVAVAAVAAPAKAAAEPASPVPAATPAAAPAPITAREQSGKINAADLKSADDKSRRPSLKGFGATPDLEPASRFDNVRHILAEEFVRVGISRDELAAGRVSADSLFGGAVPLDRAGKVLRRVSGDPQRLSADSLISEFGSSFAAEGMPAPRKPVPSASGAAIAPPAQPAPIPVQAKPAPVRPAAVKPAPAEVVTPALDMHAPLTADEERSLAEVHFNIGLMFARGEGVPKNEQLAAKWYLKAAEEGLAEAQFSLSELYASGAGVKADPSKAAYWLEMAAKGGYAPAREPVRQRNQGGL